MADMPAWLAPQIEAARQERTDALVAVCAAGVTTLDPVNAAVDATLDQWLAKQCRSCAHLREPAPAYLAFGNPRVLCNTCLDFYQAGSAAPSTTAAAICAESRS